VWFLRYPSGHTDTQTDIDLLITILGNRSRGQSNNDIAKLKVAIHTLSVFFG